VAVEYKTILVTEQLRACLSRYAQSDWTGNYWRSGAEPDIFIWGGHWRGQFCNKGSCQWSCVGLSERPTPVAWRHAENFGGARQNFGGAVAPPSSTPVEGRMCSGTYADARITSTGVWVYQPEANFHFRGTRLFQIGGPSIRFATTDVIQISTYTCSLHSL